MQETQQRLALETSAHKPWYLLDPEVSCAWGVNWWSMSMW